MFVLSFSELLVIITEKETVLTPSLSVNEFHTLLCCKLMLEEFVLSCDHYQFEHSGFRFLFMHETSYCSVVSAVIRKRQLARDFANHFTCLK